MHDNDLRLVYSLDDNGWYWQRYSDWSTSQLFSTREDAIQAKNEGTIVWDR